MSDAVQPKCEQIAPPSPASSGGGKMSLSDYPAREAGLGVA